MDNSIYDHLTFKIFQWDNTTVDTHWDAFSHEHRDGYCRLFLIEEGKGHITIEGREIYLKGGDIILIPAGTLIQLHPSPGVCLYWIHFNTFTIDGLPLFDLIKPGNFCRKSEGADKLYFTQIFHETNRDDYFKDQAIRSHLKLLLLPFLKGASSINLSRGEEGKDQWLFQVLAYINGHLQDEISIEEMAQSIGCHPTYLSNAFSKKFNIGPKHYMVKKRVEQAQQLLWHGHSPVKEIARNCGFRDIYYFHRCFKRLTGCTPGEYRRKREPYDQI